MPSNTNYYLT